MQRLIRFYSSTLRSTVFASTMCWPVEIIIITSQNMIHCHDDRTIQLQRGCKQHHQSRQSMYALRVLTAHGLMGQSLSDETYATTVLRMLCAAPAWWDFVRGEERMRLQAILRRLVRSRYTGISVILLTGFILVIFIHSFIHLFIHLFIHSFIHSSIHSFIHYEVLYSATSRLLLRSAPDLSSAEKDSFEASIERLYSRMSAHRQREPVPEGQANH